MDPTGEKRAHSTNHDSATTPPSRRRQPTMNSAESSGQQSAAVSDHPTATADAPAASSTEPNVLAPLTFAGLADSASFADSCLSPAERCPADPLSVALSFLGGRDFAAASRVCHHWCRAANLQSAWPQFSVERLISYLVENRSRWNRRTPSRSVCVNADQAKEGALQRAAQSPKWRRIAELHVCSHQWYGLVRLSQVAQLPQLQSLRLGHVPLVDVAAAFSSMAPRLKALNCDHLTDAAAVLPHLHLLANLRVLMLEDKKDKIDGQTLLALHQLEYLQLHSTNIQRDPLLLPVIRRLSVQHRLRRLSLSSYWLSTLDLDPLVTELDGEASGLAPAALIFLRLDCLLSDASHSALLSLPSLTRLEWSGDTPRHAITTQQQPSSPPSPLQQLLLNCNSENGATQMLQQAAIHAPQLRELYIHLLLPSHQLIRPLHSLCLLELWDCWPLSPEMLRSLASLPLFSELILQQSSWKPRPFHFTVDTMRCIAESSSWRRIRLVGRFNLKQIILSDDEGTGLQLAKRLADFCLQTEKAGITSVYRLEVDAAQETATWQQTAM